jgi:hypothetical protein
LDRDTKEILQVPLGPGDAAGELPTHKQPGMHFSTGPIQPLQNDCWHFVRNIEKALWKAAKLKSCGAEIGICVIFV